MDIDKALLIATGMEAGVQLFTKNLKTVIEHHPQQKTFSAEEIITMIEATKYVFLGMLELKGEGIDNG